MTLKNDAELANTREKLRELEERYAARCGESGANAHVHELTLRSLKRLINQLKEEIVRYETRQPAHQGNNGGGTGRRVLNETELANTRRKLEDLERLYETHEREIDGDEELRELSRQSLKKMMNQLKEEIIWTEVHRPAPNRVAQS